MPMLTNPQNEQFATLVAKGVDAKKAFRSAGYTAKNIPVGVHRLLKDAKIAARINELKEMVSSRVAAAVSFEAKSMFEDLVQDIKDCKEAGDYKAAADLRKFLIRCFGYEDSPTLTHEKVLGEKIPVANHQPGDGEKPEESAPTANVLAFTNALKKYANR